MSDRDLLIKAAKAAGIKLCEDNFGVLRDCTGLHPQLGNVLAGKPWNPLSDDGDALRLAVKLVITVIQYGSSCICEDPYGYCLSEEEKEGGADDFAATRRCIVRAAAVIGPIA